jgi:DNA-binding XRE family transcriptional regulator
MTVVLHAVAPVREPVTLIQELAGAGLGLQRAHKVVGRLVAENDVPVRLPGVQDRLALIARLEKLGIGVSRRRTPENVDPKAIRNRLGLTQEEFADRFALDASTVRNWEQRRNVPDAAARTLLRVIEICPEAVDAAVEEEAPDPGDAVAGP